MTGPSPTIVERASAKINLSLEIVGRRPDGYHDLLSLVAFAPAIADTVTLSTGNALGVTVTGPNADELAGDNIVDTLLASLNRTEPDLLLGHVTIDKKIPIAAGLGGGSADAAAALRAIGAANRVADIERRFAGLAANLGADVPVCLGGRGSIGAVMAGMGETVVRPQGRSPIPPGLFVLLVNPGRPVSTAEVFRRLDAPRLVEAPAPKPSIGPFANADDLIAYLLATRNDLEPPARAIEPMIATVLNIISAQDGCRLARMSGSGATCFGLFLDDLAARAAGRAIRSAAPDWWCETSPIS